jgi:hypothetical protein
VVCATTAPHRLPRLQFGAIGSLGKVLDVYWQFDEAGDAYPGCWLCGLDPNHRTFSLLPPHWLDS